ncbi:alginate lyase family protein [Parasphingopyxis sp. CP4]|uniref:alginate lyase family protein n=1 Tax=Parasphingopyxis sp. CP4 TaxID=2724527 RepID=UPI0015A1F199|nr:alginate lyase family protein [Parasphingopyxis sp. CP4]QLC20782.1 alginate lyase family protein [Parasphingopyxis sp. CP4]
MKRALPLILAAAASAAAAPAIAQDTAPSGAVQAPDVPPLFAAETARAREFVDEMIAAGITVPVPADPGGGYTHEQHKRNFRAMFLASHLYNLSDDQRYFVFVRDMLLEYADLYPTLEDHPARSNQNPGRLFWQVLNDAMWLVHAIQAYEVIRDDLDSESRDRIDNDVFRRAAHFLSVESEATFNRIHNHATWATAAVGMTGYVLGDDELVRRALYGTQGDGESGFLRQTELLFSPDGYYTEGPYYQRFALLPFMVFAGAIERNEPERAIFEHRDGILRKALLATIQLTYGGYFFPFNDAIRDKSLNTAELYQGVAIGYSVTRDPSLLGIAQFQNRTMITPAGLQVAEAIEQGLAEEFPFRSMVLRDGPNGQQGAVAIMRNGSEPGHMALVAKNASQGMGHGHFDKLSWQLYDNGHEIVRDYGAARFLNIEAKEGGRYLPENESWAKQTVAHNTLVVNQQSHFYGDRDLADQSAPTQQCFGVDDELQFSVASIDDAYPRESVTMERMLAMVEIDGLSAPIALDVLRAQGDGALQFDLPLHYAGHIMRLGFDVDRNTAGRPILGDANGYQHIWVDGRARPDGEQSLMTWLLDGRFYTYRFVQSGELEVILGETGANDPSFNLRREPIAIQRVSGTDRATFVSLVEPHGLYDGATEQTIDSDSQIASLHHIRSGTTDIAVIETITGAQVAVAVSWDSNAEAEHSATVNGQELRWQGCVARISLSRGES